MRRGNRLSLLSQTQGWGLLPSSMVTVVTSSRTLQPTFRLLQTSAVRDHLKARLTLYLEPALDKRLRAEAARHDLTIGRYVTHLLLSRPGVEIRSPIEARRVARRFASRRVPEPAIAEELNRRGYRTKTGRPWTQMSVSRLLRS